MDSLLGILMMLFLTICYFYIADYVFKQLFRKDKEE